MYLKCHRRFKDWKEHRYWSIVESVRTRRGVIKRQLLYLGEINDAQQAQWCSALDVLDESNDSVQQMTLFPEDRTPPAEISNPVQIRLNRQKLRRTRRGEGTYLLRTNLTGDRPEELWKQYIVLTEIEQAFKEIKQDLSIRPIYHQKDDRTEAHIFVSFLAYCLQVTLKQRAKAKAPGLTPRAILEKFKAMQMIDVHLPTTDGRNLMLPRYTQPEKDIELLIHQLNLTLPEQPPPRLEELKNKCGADLRVKIEEKRRF